MFGGDNEIGNMLQEAVKLKTAQINQKRRTYETWPFFVQHTIFHGEKDDPPIRAWRQLPFAEKIVISERIKEEGNQRYNEKDWSGAVDKYEEAPTLVYYCYSTDPGWRKNNRGIDDDVLVLVDDHGETEEDKKAQEKLRTTCALNIAACKLHQQKFDEVVAACTAVIKLDDQSVKAYYRRAEALIRPNSATAYDYDMAIKDLVKAQSIDPKNTTVSRLLVQLRADRKLQREKDNKTFSGMFGRGELYDGEGDPAQGGVLAQSDKYGQLPDAQTLQSRIDNITDDDDLEKRAKDAELLRDLYMRNGKVEEAKELNEKIKAAKKHLKDKEEQPMPALDWDNPTPEMIEDAKKHGLDLTDPVVVAELKRLEQEAVDGKLPPMPSEGEEDASAGSFPWSTDIKLPSAAENSVLVPWGRYVALLVFMCLFFRLADMGAWRNLFLYMFLGQPLMHSGDNQKSGIFTSLYKSVVSTVGLDDEGDL